MLNMGYHSQSMVIDCYHDIVFSHFSITSERTIGKRMQLNSEMFKKNVGIRSKPYVLNFFFLLLLIMVLQHYDLHPCKFSNTLLYFCMLEQLIF